MQNRDYACAMLFFCYLSTTVAQLLFDFTKHAVAHFAPILASCLLVLTILCFQDTEISATVAQLLFDVIKHPVAHFAPFFAPFLLVLAILCFQDIKTC